MTLGRELSNTYCKFYFIYSGSDLAGYIKLNYAPAQSDLNDSNSVEVERIYVRKEHQGKRLGKMSMEYIFQQAISENKTYVWLGVWEKNVNAISFYQKLGFEEIGQHSFRMGNEIQSDLIMKKVVTLSTRV
jgi:ribosomal protein S18 acetylase RimI-like enzyme